MLIAMMGQRENVDRYCILRGHDGSGREGRYCMLMAMMEYKGKVGTAYSRS